MSDFINTVDVIGDDALIDQIITRTITEIKDDKVEVIGDYAFWKAEQLKIAEFPSATQVNIGAFRYCTALTTVDLPNVTTMGNAFTGCTALTTVNLPKLKTVGASNAYAEGPFANCTSLARIDLPSATFLGGDAFAGCTALEEVTGIEQITWMGVAVFSGCTKIKKLEFNAVTSLSQYAFRNCSALETLILRSSKMCSMGVASLNGSAIASGTGYVYVPAALVDTYIADSGWSPYAAQIRAIEDYPEITGG